MPQPAAASSKKEASRSEVGSNRDFIEQIVVALVLALLIRGFEAEAFVIPTGSMATTLMGRHKDVVCQSCGVTFEVNASNESDDSSASSRIVGGTCMNCRFPMKLDSAPSFRGDRILVMKFLYDLRMLPGGGGPDRWDVVVFKYPEGPEVNYIKRLVGMPDEVLQILGGDVRVRPLDQPSAPFKYPRRPLDHQTSMQMLVWDDSHHPAQWHDRPEWRRWQPKTDRGWSIEEPRRNGRPWLYTSSASDSNWTELRYQHLVPDPVQWNAVLTDRPLPYALRPTLITDFYSYNSNVPWGAVANQGGDGLGWFQPDWVGDLTLSGQVQATEAKGLLKLELIKGGTSNRCEIDLATGQATLYHGQDALGPPAATPLRDTSSHDVSFANVDGRLTLWVDRRTPFGDGLVYDDGTQPPAVPTAADLDPVGIATRSARVTVSGLVLKRDIYYTHQPGPSDYYNSDLRRPGDRPVQNPADRVAWLFDVLADAKRFPELGKYQPGVYPIRPGHYMMLGDNSPCSKDSRGWSRYDQTGYYDSTLGKPVDAWATDPRESWEVPASLLIGKAFFVYWPHAWPIWPDIAINQDFHVPFVPNFQRMKCIR